MFLHQSDLEALESSLEIHESSPRFQNFVVEESNEERRVNLDLLDEAREEARIKAEAMKRRVER